MAERFFIDGYDRRVYFAAVRNVHPEFRFTHRWVTVMEQSRVLEGVRYKNLAEQQEYVAAQMAPRIVTWSADRPVSPANLLALPPSLFHRIYNAMYGNEPGDLDPLDQEVKLDAAEPLAAAKN